MTVWIRKTWRRWHSEPYDYVNSVYGQSYEFGADAKAVEKPVGNVNNSGVLGFWQRGKGREEFENFCTVLRIFFG